MPLAKIMRCQHVELDWFAIGCTVGGSLWSAVTGHRFASLAVTKAATSRRTPKQAVSPLPYTEVKPDLILLITRKSRCRFDAANLRDVAALVPAGNQYPLIHIKLAQ